MLNYRTLPFLPLPPQMPTPDEEQTALQRRMRGELLPPPAKGGPALQSIVLKACAYRPEDRYATPEEFLRALKAVRAADTSTVDTIPDAQPVVPAAEPSFPDADATMGNNWETTGGRDDSDYTETFNTDPTMGTMGTESGASASSGAKRQDAARGKDVYTQVRITPQEAAAGCKVETRDAADRYVRVPSRAGSKTGGSSACLALVLPEPTAVHRAIFWYGSMCKTPRLKNRCLRTRRMHRVPVPALCPPHLQRRPAAAPGKAKRRSCSVMPASRRKIGKCISFRTRLWRSWG